MSRDQPPRLPGTTAKLARPKDSRTAFALNLIIPGAGQFYLGQRWVGGAFALAFLACFVAMIAVFVLDFKNYFELAMNGSILEGEQLEKMRDGFHWKCLFVLLGAGILIYVAALAAMAVVPRPAPPAPSGGSGEVE